jgi:hypothetical protein
LSNTTTLSGSTTTTKRIQQTIGGTGYDSVNGVLGLAKNAAAPITQQTAINFFSPLVLKNTPASGTLNYEMGCYFPEVGKFIFASRSGGSASNQLITGDSTGNTWSFAAYSATANTGWASVVYGKVNNLPAIVVFSGSGAANTEKIMYSYDLVSFTLASCPMMANLSFQGRSAVVYSPQLNMWMAALSTGGISNVTQQLIYSSDGLNWNQCVVSNPLALTPIRSMAWSPELKMFVIIRTGGAQHYYSFTGIDILTGPTQSFTLTSGDAIAWSPTLNLFSLAIPGPSIAVSNDGLVWTPQSVLLADVPQSFLWIPQLACMAATFASGTGNRMGVSFDGITFQRLSTPSDLSYIGQAYNPEGGGVWVSVPSTNVAQRAMVTSLSGRIPINSNVFNSSYNNIDNNGAWQAKVRNIYNDTGSTITVSNPIGNRLQQQINSGSTYASTQGYYALDKQKWPIPNPLVGSAQAVSIWNYQTAPSSNSWTSICWAEDLRLACAVGVTGTGNRIMTSGNLKTWTSRTSVSDVSWQSVVYGGPTGNKLFVACASGGSPQLMTSPDATTWSAATSVVTQGWYSLAYSRELNLWICVSKTGTDRVMYATDPTSTWTIVAGAGSTGGWQRVTWGGGQSNRFVAVASNGTNRVMYSSLGSSGWTAIPSVDETAVWMSVVFSRELNLYCAIANTFTTFQCMVSTDGISWTGVSIPSHPYTSVVWCDAWGLFVALATDSTVAYSADGYNWYTASSQANTWMSLAWVPQYSQCVGVSSDGGANCVMTSSLHGRQPTQYNVFNNPSNRIDETTGDWTFQASNVTTPNQDMVIGSTAGNTTILANPTPDGSLIQFLGSSDLVALSAGSATGKFLQIRINSIIYKIPLYNVI